jgi:DNA-binding MarR family transcriptional regulator
MPHWLKDDDGMNEALLMHEVARLLRHRFEQRAQSLKLTRAQWQALSVLRRRPGCTQAELADRLEVKPITLTRLLDRLEKAGWVRRAHDRKDRRVRRLYLTARVEPVVRRMRALGMATRREALKGFSRTEHMALLACLNKMKINLCGGMAS